jgi:CheY-like chemotaxis protein
MGVALDITEIKNAEVAKQQFLSNMSHEIRTPLNAIIGMTHLLLAEQVPPEMQENLKILKFSGENLLVLVNDILDYSKILSGKVSFESIDFSLRDFVQSIRQSHLFKATEKGITLKMKLDSDLPDRLNGDPMRLAQVLNNLISNAIKFTNAGSVTVDLTLGEMGPQHVTIDFAIRDTGIGIDPSLKEFIFESFTQASADTTRRFGGTGLGLAITRSLLQLQGSDIFLESEIGKGSLFYFRLRLGKSQKETFSVSNQLFGETTGEKKDLAGYKVLLVEDNEMNRIVAKKFMTRWALEVAYAQNGVEAVGMMEEEHYHLVLMDLQMPRMDGYEATRRIRALPGCERLPIIALTASVEPEVMEKIKLAGMTDYMSKPFNPNELYAKIAQHLSL